KVARRQPEQQNEQAWCLTVVTNAVVCWHTEYMGLAVGELRTVGREVDAEVLAVAPSTDDLALVDVVIGAGVRSNDWHRNADSPLVRFELATRRGAVRATGRAVA
ncbi:hypothetical protein ADL35_25195, partial [Streptomyces sp. NRRL WC-3753]